MVAATVENDLIARLKPLCLGESEEVRKSYEGIKAPFSYEYEGVRYVCATDGRLAVFIKSDIEAPQCSANFDVIFAKYTASDVRVNTAALFEFTGAPEYDKPCDCPYCDEGAHGPDPRKGFIGDVLCDLNLLARGLSVVPAGECEVSLNGNDAIFLRGDGWWITLMPMRNRDDNTDAPRFDI